MNFAIRKSQVHNNLFRSNNIFLFLIEVYFDVKQNASLNSIFLTLLIFKIINCKIISLNNN